MTPVRNKNKLMMIFPLPDVFPSLAQKGKIEREIEMKNVPEIICGSKYIGAWANLDGNDRTSLYKDVYHNAMKQLGGDDQYQIRKMQRMLEALRIKNLGENSALEVLMKLGILLTEYPTFKGAKDDR